VILRFVNILSPGISKGEAVEYLTQHLSLSRAQVMGVGDGPNDDPLLRAVGFPVAMGNSIDALKQIATYVAPDVEDDGLAQVIEQFILSVEYRA
jgi:hydroxymethylpyrimidine pyrophosphatase-like HAD family hydrolase